MVCVVVSLKTFSVGVCRFCGFFFLGFSLPFPFGLPQPYLILYLTIFKIVLPNKVNMAELASCALYIHN